MRDDQLTTYDYMIAKVFEELCVPKVAVPGFLGEISVYGIHGDIIVGYRGKSLFCSCCKYIFY